jgi:hypothetical protein
MQFGTRALIDVVGDSIKGFNVLSAGLFWYARMRASRLIGMKRC